MQNGLKIMKRMLKLLASAPPQLLLDHYLNVLGLISWRIFAERRDKEHLTISNLIKKLLRDSQSINPFYSRECLRSIAVVEEVLNEMVALGLLTKDGEVFQKTRDFSEFYYLLKNKVKKSLRRYIAWAIWYLYHQKGLTSFSTSELLTLISYRDEDYVNEIPHLIKRKNGWLKLLEKSGDEWKLVEEPHVPSSPILLTDLHDRLSNAIFELAKTKSKFCTEEVIKKLRELEQVSAERTLKRLGLRFEDEKWQIDEKALNDIKRLLEAETKRWSSLGVIVFKNPYFKLQSKTMYVDMPNTTIWNFLSELKRICYEHKDDPGKMYEKAKELATSFNRQFEKEIGKWFLFIIRKQFFGSKPFGVQIKINWKQFYSFLDDFAGRGAPLRDKYSYLLNCRAPSLTLVLRGDLERVQQEVKELCKEEIEQICQNLKNLINEVNEAKKYLFKITSYRKTIPIEPATLEYFPEMMSLLRALTFLIKNGTIPACYREMRKILENLSWVIMDDLLLYRSSIFKRKRHTAIFFIPPYRFVSKEWYNWASQGKFVIRNLGELEKKVKNLTQVIYTYGEREGYSWGKKQIRKVFLKRISYPLFLLLVGINTQVPKTMEGLIPQYEVEVLKNIAAEDLKTILKDLGCKHPSKLVDTLINELIFTIVGKVQKIVPPYPSNEFVLGFVSKALSNELLRPYKEYSHFVHSYFTSWHIFPFSSVLEFKIFRHELFAFTRLLLQLINSYLGQLFIKR